MPRFGRLVFTLFAVLLCSSTIRAQLTGNTISPAVSKFFPDINGNLTKVTWAHAVNSRAELVEALNSGVMMLEADIVMGTLNTSDSTELIPIMGHPPANVSDISLEQFLNEVLASKKHGVKLDFKTIEVFNASREILAKVRSNMTFPVWINADILSGPVNSTGTPVDAASFLYGAAETFPESTLSIGWTTRYGNDDAANITEGSYSPEHVNAMINTVKTNNVTTQPISYPVRAGIAAKSIDTLQTLISGSPAGATLTIWSSEGDDVDADKLSEVILKIGVTKVYIDVPEAVFKRLHISSGVSGAKIGALTFGTVLAAVAIIRLF